MTNSLIITIPGKPIAKKRPRFARRGKFVVAYSDQQTEEGKWILTARQFIKEKIPEGVPILLKCIFWMPIPKSISQRKHAEILHERHIRKPDLDNMLKFIKDCLNGELWNDDSQVAEVRMGKIYDDNPRTEITVSW